MRSFLVISVCCLLLGYAFGVHGAPDDPVVHILGRDELNRPTHTSVLVPAVISIDSRENAAGTEVPSPQVAAVVLDVPIGAVVAWMKSMTNTPALPLGWVECNGKELSDSRSPYHGMIIPNLNGAEGATSRFLRGNTESGASGGSSQHSHGGVRSQKYGTQRKPVAATVRASHLPPYHDVTWIMRVR